MLLTLCLLALIFFFVVVFYALYCKHHVRATFKGPFSTFHIEFEADDEKRDPKP
jgi:hypothetical protein